MATQRKFTAEEVQQKMNALPPEIKELLGSPEMVSIIQKVGEKNHLHYDQMGVLEIETTNLMLGFTEPADFVSLLTKNLGIEESLAESVAKDINELLISKARDSMKQHSEPQANPEKSVLMPSAVKTPPAPVVSPVAVASVPPPSVAPAPAATAPAPSAKPAELPAMAHIDAMLTAPTVSIAPKPAPAPSPAPTAPVTPPPATPAPATTAKVEAPKPPPIYKTDPYHEPID